MIIDQNIFSYIFLKNMIFNFNSYELIFKFFILDVRFILSIIFLLIAFYFTKNKKVFYFSLSIGMAYIFSLVIVFLISPYDLIWTLETTVSRVITSPTLLFSFFGLLQIYNKMVKVQ